MVMKECILKGALSGIVKHAMELAQQEMLGAQWEQC